MEVTEAIDAVTRYLDTRPDLPQGPVFLLRKSLAWLRSVTPRG